MIWRILALMLWPLMAGAQTVPVSTGEHDGFTRLVIDYGAPVDWQVGRTGDGYALSITGDARGYDLSQAFRIIGKTRLAALWTNPETGALQIGIGCACHAIPFEFRPGIVVIDLHDGPPPTGSAFEIAVTGDAAQPLADHPQPRPRRRPGQAAPAYDWTQIAPDPGPQAPADLPDTDPNLEPLREALLQQLSRGAARGVIDMTVPQQPRASVADAASVRMALGALPGLVVDPGDAALTAEGATCVTDDRIAIAQWGDGRPVIDQMADQMSGMMGEFDRPDPASLTRAVRFLLHLGFGAEARQVLTVMPANLPDAELFRSMAHVLDGDTDPQPAFAAMSACATDAALWAVLSGPAPVKGAAFDRAAVLRAFSALPIHLRRHLGPDLAARLITLGDTAAAQAAQDAVLRAPGAAGPAADLTDARLRIAEGDAAAATKALQPLIDAPGPATSEALITLVELRLAQQQPVAAADVIALAAGLQERLGSRDAPRYRRALLLARASNGDFATAFAELPQAPDAAADLWGLVAALAPDSALLDIAVTAPDTPLPGAARPVAASLAQRLSDLGFAAAASRWLDLAGTDDPLLAARLDLQRGDARRAVRRLQGRGDAAALILKSEALQRLGDDAASAEALTLAGQPEAAWPALARARDWPRLATDGPAPWQEVAAALSPATSQPPEAPLARGHALVDISTATRTAVEALLAEVAGPEPLSQ